MRGRTFLVERAAEKSATEILRWKRLIYFRNRKSANGSGVTVESLVKINLRKHVNALPMLKNCANKIFSNIIFANELFKAKNMLISLSKETLADESRKYFDKVKICIQTNNIPEQSDEYHTVVIP